MIPWRDHNLPNCKLAKEKEMNGWKENNTYCEVEDHGQKRIETMWILTEKMIDGKQGVKARLVAKGNQEKAVVQADAPTGTKDSLFMVLALGAMYNWKPKTCDVKNAFLQGQHINRTVFVEPPKDQKKEGKIWKLNKCVYGLDDAARSWFLEVENDLKEMGCKQSRIDPCVFFFFQEKVLDGVIFLHVDDFFHMGSNEFENKVVKKIKSTYIIGKCEDGSFTYTGLNIKDSQNGIMIDQLQYISEIHEVDVPSNPKQKNSDSVEAEGRTGLRRLVGQANWAARRSRPDASFDLLELSMRFNNAVVEDLKRAQKVTNKLKNSDVKILFPRLGENLRIFTFSDASFANLVDGVSSGRGHVIFLVDDGLRCAPLNWASNKVKRVVSSTLAAETLSLKECINTAEYIRYMLGEALQRKPQDILIRAYTDSNDLAKACYSTLLVSDKKLRIDIASIKESIEEENVSVKWISKSYMLADCLTKKGADTSNLMSVLQCGCLNIPDE